MSAKNTEVPNDESAAKKEIQHLIVEARDRYSAFQAAHTLHSINAEGAETLVLGDGTKLQLIDNTVKR